MGSVDSNANRKKRGNENEIDLRIEKEIPTLTLDDNGAGGDLPVTRRGHHRRCAGQGCAAARRSAAQGAAARRRGARARAPKRGAVNGELDGGALTQRRSRAPASKPRQHRLVILSAVTMAATAVSW